MYFGGLYFGDCFPARPFVVSQLKICYDNDIKTNVFDSTKKQNKEGDITMLNQESFVIQDHTLLQYRGQEEEVTLPAEITSISASAFQSCVILKTVTMQANYICIQSKGLFDGCSNLTKVSIFDEVEDRDGKRFTRPVALREYLGLAEQAELQWECPTIWCLEDRCQFCGGKLKGSVMRSCTFCGRIN